MTDDLDRHPIHQREMAFFGAVTASVTHEINNVIAIVGELNGLLGDLVAGAEAGCPLDLEKVDGILGTAERHIDRGKIIVKRLSRFAHSVDEPVSTINPGVVLDNLVKISSRLADMKKLRIEAVLPDEPTYMTTNPFILQQAVFSCIELFLNALPAGEGIVVELLKEDEIFKVTVSGSTSVGADKALEKLEAIGSLMASLGGKAELGGEGKETFVLTGRQAPVAEKC